MDMKKALVVLTTLMAGYLLGFTAWATTLPAGIMRYAQSLDHKVKVRQDGLITLSNGMIYLPVMPQDPTVDLNPSKITRQWLGKDGLPDLVQFNNNLFLMRFTKSGRGKLTTAKMVYPIELKEGLLPQDLQLPAGLILPAELKVILGGINYANRSATTDTAEVPALPIYQPGTASNGVIPNQSSYQLPASQLYLADATTQQLLALNLATGQPVSKTDLGCMPSAMAPTPGGLMALVTCLNANQLLVVDPITQQVRSQFATGQRPSAVMIANENTVWVANRFDKFLTVFPLVPVLKETGDKTDEESRLTVETLQVPLPTPADMLMPGPTPTSLLAVDSASGSAHWVDVNTKTVKQSIKTQPALSGAILSGEKLWTISRNAPVVRAFNIKTGQEEKTATVGKKPVSLVMGGHRLYVLCAEDHRVDVVDPAAGTVLTTVPLPDGSFPTSLVWNGKQLYAAAQSEVYVINLDSYHVETTWQGRASVLSFNVPPESPQLEPINALSVQTPDNATDTPLKPAVSTRPKKRFGGFGNFFKL